ncbi:hypothetical protein BJ138DRAFT_1118568 [Hygrophoropsis aurantiaca]|uniref:Uncharacterized protein n=1 Tax=Hygrophoropsis aurantiaca TaxID=72124 RepID=A0ACB7ZXA1_9AGAM|nr:hypothetical protein BJ138DRAFT_1118568 [Hygrophoropsis aurantiaca]
MSSIHRGHDESTRRPHRSILLDARRWPFFGGLVPPSNLSGSVRNTDFMTLRSTTGSPIVANGKGNGDVEQAGFEYDAPPGGNSGDGGAGGGASQPKPHTHGEAEENTALVSAWQDRLQVLTVVTTFLASMDGQLFSLTTLPSNISHDPPTACQELVYASLSGALIFHICASILGYLASFALIKYTIIEASAPDEDDKLGGILSSPSSNPHITNDTVSVSPTKTRKHIVLESRHPLNGFRSSAFASANNHKPVPPIALLTRCYYTTLALTAVGFILALLGILSYIWAGLMMPVGIFSTACLGVGLGAALWAIS